jgi:5-methylcytosine-specific restriction enzyme subunit McrC
VNIDTINLYEYQESDPFSIITEDLDHVRDALSTRISSTGPFEGDLFRFNPGPYVGVAMLPSGRRLRAHPKVAVQSVLYMLGVAHRLNELKGVAAQFDKLDGIVEALASVFAGAVERRLQRGLYRAYVEREENLTAVRGRISMIQDLRSNFVLRHRVYCRFADFTWDIPENQVIRQVAHLLGRWDFAAELRLRLAQIDAALAEITPTTLPARAIDSFVYHRLNDDYRPIHQLCRLVLEGAAVSENEGPFAFPTFFVNMNDLFEQFVTEILESRANGRIGVRRQHPGALDRDNKVGIIPDILVDYAYLPKIAIDCKYKRLSLDDFKGPDLYQVLAYCTATPVDRGLLIYPRHTGGIIDEISVSNSPVVIRQRTIDLNLSPSALALESDRLTESIFEWARLASTHHVAA